MDQGPVVRQPHLGPEQEVRLARRADELVQCQVRCSNGWRKGHLLWTMHIVIKCQEPENLRLQHPNMSSLSSPEESRPGWLT